MESETTDGDRRIGAEVEEREVDAAAGERSAGGGARDGWLGFGLRFRLAMCRLSCCEGCGVR